MPVPASGFEDVNCYSSSWNSSRRTIPWGAQFSYEDPTKIRIDGGTTMEFHARWDAALLSCDEEIPDRL